MTNSKIDELKNKASEIGDDLKIKAEEAKLQGEKVVDDVIHSAKETKLEGEKALNDLKKETQESQTDHKAALSEKIDAAKEKATAELVAIGYPSTFIDTLRPNFLGNLIPHEGFELTNLNARLSRVQWHHKAPTDSQPSLRKACGDSVRCT